MKAHIDLRIADEGRPDLRAPVQLHDIDAGHIMEQGGATVTAMRTVHPRLIDCFAFFLKSADTHVVFSGDTAPIATFADFARVEDWHKAVAGHFDRTSFAGSDGHRRDLLDHD
ncbi:hypothetical protein [Yoonia rosea]|uniref:hypothetical protein n=1 Tax=Yoonia rosea TaxID=287098 RepID=UPI0009766364|nr:hypothetical protein [Yoonia rosea]